MLTPEWTYRTAPQPPSSATALTTPATCRGGTCFRPTTPGRTCQHSDRGAAKQSLRSRPLGLFHLSPDGEAETTKRAERRAATASAPPQLPRRGGDTHTDVQPHKEHLCGANTRDALGDAVRVGRHRDTVADARQRWATPLRGGRRSAALGDTRRWWLTLGSAGRHRTRWPTRMRWAARGPHDPRRSERGGDRRDHSRTLAGRAATGLRRERRCGSDGADHDGPGKKVSTGRGPGSPSGTP